MKPITINKLNPFILQVLQEENPKDMFKPLLQIYTADSFSIASNGYIAAVIYNSEDHDLNFTFGDCMDTIVSLFKSGHNNRYNHIDYQIVLNRKEVLENIEQQFKNIKFQIKEKYKICIKESDATTRVEIDCETNKLYLATSNGNIINKKDVLVAKYGEFSVTEQPNINIDFIESKYNKLNTWESAYNTKYIIDLLNFMAGYDKITLWTGGRAVQNIRCEEQDREIILMPVRVNN